MALLAAKTHGDPHSSDTVTIEMCESLRGWDSNSGEFLDLSNLLIQRNHPIQTQDLESSAHPSECPGIKKSAHMSDEFLFAAIEKRERYAVVLVWIDTGDAYLVRDLQHDDVYLFAAKTIHRMFGHTSGSGTLIETVPVKFGIQEPVLCSHLARYGAVPVLSPEIIDTEIVEIRMAACQGVTQSRLPGIRSSEDVDDLSRLRRNCCRTNGRFCSLPDREGKSLFRHRLVQENAYRLFGRNAQFGE